MSSEMFQDRTTSRQLIDLWLYLLKLHTTCILKIQVLYPQEANPRGSRVPLLPAGKVWTGVYAAKQKV